MREMTFAASQLRVPRIEVNGGATQLMHAGLEGQPRARALLLEDHHQRTVEQRMVGLVALELVLDPARAGKDMFQLFAGKVLQLQKMLRRGHVLNTRDPMRGIR